MTIQSYFRTLKQIKNSIVTSYIMNSLISNKKEYVVVKKIVYMINGKL